MISFKVVYDLTTVLRTLKEELGLSQLSPAQRDAFLAEQSLIEHPEMVVLSVDIRPHDLVKQLPPATYHRALRALVAKGLLLKAKGAKTKTYVVNSEAPQTLARSG